MTKSIKSLLSIGLTVGILSAIGCSKSSELGLSLVEQEQTDIVYTDTLTLELSTVPAIKTAMYIPGSERSQMTVGAYTDPTFGEAEASAYINFRLTRTNPTFVNCVFDSLVLSLAYESFGHYGSVEGTNNTPLTWDILQMSSPILEQEYDSDATFSTSRTLKSGFLFTPQVSDSVLLGTELTPPHLRIRLDDLGGMNLGNEFLFPSDPTVYNSNSDFKNWFNGLYIRPTSGANNTSIIRLEARNDFTKITIHYTDTTGGTAEAKVFEFLTDEDSESVSTFEHNYTGTTILNNNPSDTFVSVQGMDGVHTRIAFPTIDSLGDIIVNKAELVLNVSDTGSVEYYKPIVLLAKSKTSTNELELIEDIVSSIVQSNGTSSTALFGGIIESDLGRNNFLYRFYISEYMQRLVEGAKMENAIYITTPSALDPERIQLVNQQATTGKAKLYLTYTKIN
jgi:hypothetical protein